MHSVVWIVLIVLGVALVIGGIVAVVALRKARDGFEDEHGFHPDGKG